MRSAGWLALLLVLSACGTDDPLVRKGPAAGKSPAQPKALPAPKARSPQPRPAARPHTVADVLAAGGRLMGIVELQDFLPGTSWNSYRQSGYYRTRLLEDGRYHNTLLARGEVNLDSHGYWYVDPEGRACSKPALDHPKVKPMCSYWFKSGERYFVGAGKKPGDRVFPRKVLRYIPHRSQPPTAASSLPAVARKPEPREQHGSGVIGPSH